MQESLGTSHADTEVGRESERDRVGVRLNPWVKVLVEVIVLERDKYSAGMQHDVCDDAQKSLCDASKGAREPDAESGCVMWPSCCMRRWRFICYLRIAGGSGTESRGLARFVSARLQPTMGRGSLHQGRSSGIFVAAVICDALRWTAHVTQGMISSVLTVWKEGRSRKGIMDGLRKFIAVDNHEAVVGWLAPRHRVFPGGAANVYSRFLIRSHPLRSGRGYTAGA